MTTQQLWRAIHVYPFKRGTVGFDQLLVAVRALLPGSCTCRDDFDAYLAANPPDTSSTDAMFAWGWRFHQHVNAKLGKPGLMLDEARAMHAPTVTSPTCR